MSGALENPAAIKTKQNITKKKRFCMLYYNYSSKSTIIAKKPLTLKSHEKLPRTKPKKMTKKKKIIELMVNYTCNWSVFDWLTPPLNQKPLIFHFSPELMQKSNDLMNCKSNLKRKYHSILLQHQHKSNRMRSN